MSPKENENEIDPDWFNASMTLDERVNGQNDSRDESYFEDVTNDPHCWMNSENLTTKRKSNFEYDKEAKRKRIER